MAVSSPVFVEVISSPHNTWGIGKIIRADRQVALVQYFDSPGAPQAQTIEVRVSDLQGRRLAPQTRVYRRFGARWQVGRVLEDEGASFFVQFPNGETINIDANDLHVRWNRALIDPLPLLCSEATETPMLANARSAFVEQVMRQRTAAAGIPAILSAAIELQDYQFEVVRRVLTDPVQRYLLADEVGLGKTIEAGIILRQHFLDDDDARAVVVVPAPLVKQWREELSCRFGLQAVLDDMLHVISHDDLDRLKAVLHGVGMLVVDEAHHLSRRRGGSSAELYDLLKAQCLDIPKLLLLSATPVLADEEGFLRVLHLLDPVAFPLDDLAGFQRRVASRQLVAEVVMALVPENLWGLPPELDRLESSHGDDEVLTGKITALRTILDEFPGEDDERYVSALADLRIHLQESYKLHRRMLRNRRSTLTWAAIGRAGVRRVPFLSTAVARHRELWETLRHLLNQRELVTDVMAVSLVSAALHVHGRINVRDLVASTSYASPELIQLAEAIDKSAEDYRQEESRFTALVEEVTAQLGTPDLQVVVFCDHPADADRAAKLLKSTLGSLVERHELWTEDALDEEAAPWQAFMGPARTVRVLVCDARAEEGINLHGGRKCAVHFDLPLAPNRIEQRMGRLDRFGSGQKVTSVVLIDEGSSDAGQWAQILSDGWQVFDRSVASLQYLIESSTRELSTAWLHHGSKALSEHLNRLAGPEGLVSRETREIDRQDALDALSQPDEDSMEALDECDADWRAWRQGFEQFALEAVKFQRRYEGAALPTDLQPDPAFRVGYAYRGNGQQTLLPMSGFLQHFLQGIDRQAQRGGAGLPLSHKYVYSRRNATSRAANSQGVHLLRVGDPLVTALERVCEYDDRGRAFAVWRVDREFQASNDCGADLYFRFDFIVSHGGLEPKDDGKASASARALERKALAFFPPRFVRVWVDGSGQVLNTVPELLGASYTNRWTGTRRDFNLNPERWKQLPGAVRATWLQEWTGLCQDRRGQAEDRVLQNKEVLHHIQSAMSACDQEERLAQAQYNSRAARLDPKAKAAQRAELELAQIMYHDLRESFRRPRLSLDVVGAYFLAGEELSAE
jgi:ATP-dependent helicase HepA